MKRLIWTAAAAITFIILSIGFITYINAPVSGHWGFYIWIIILANLNFALILFSLATQQKSKLLVVLPSILISMFALSLASVFLAVLAYFFDSLLQSWHLVSQLIFIAISVVLFNFLRLPLVVTDDKEPSSIILKNELGKLIERRYMVKKDIKIKKKIMDKVKYDLPHDQTLKENPSWLEIDKIIKSSNSPGRGELQRVLRLIEEIR